MRISPNDVHKILIWIMMAVICFLGGYVFYLNKKVHTKIEVIETVASNNGKYTQFYYEREFESLKLENKALYDSIKNQKKFVTSVQQFSYTKKYKVDTVYVEKQVQEMPQELQDTTYVYSDDVDSLKYKLQINSKLPPNWYSLDIDVKDNFTIVNKEYADGRLATSITTENGATIDNITAWQKPTSKKWYQRFTFGPAVTAGYDPINKNFGVVVGVSVTYNILGK